MTPSKVGIHAPQENNPHPYIHGGTPSTEVISLPAAPHPNCQYSKSQQWKKQLSALIPYHPCMVYLHKMLLIRMVYLPKMLWICMVFMYREICKHPHGWYGNFRNVVRLAQAKIQDLFELL